MIKERRPLTNQAVALTLICVVILGTDISVWLNIPIMRQILGFVFLMVLPGQLLVVLLRLDSLDTASKIVYTVGLSQLFIIVCGYLENEIGVSVGSQVPLAPLTVALCFSIVYAGLAVAGLFTNRNGLRINRIRCSLGYSDYKIVCLCLAMLALSVTGALIMRYTGNNLCLIGLLIMIPVVVISLMISRKQLSDGMYPFVAFMIGLALVLAWAFRTSHIFGADSHYEYYLFETTFQTLKWQIHGSNIINSALSVSILPAIYEVIMRVNPEYLFKVLYPVVFSFAPIAVYRLARNYTGSIGAFFAAFYFESFYRFSNATFLARNDMGIFFFALMIISVFEPRFGAAKKKLVFILFAIATILAHYSSAYVMLFFLVCMYILVLLLGKVFPFDNNPQVTNDKVKAVNLLSICLVFSVLFLWYSQVTYSAFDVGVNFIIDAFRSLTNVFVAESREIVPGAFGVGIVHKEIAKKIEFVFDWAAIMVTMSGVGLSIFEKWKRKVNTFRLDYLAGGLICLGILVVSVVFPEVSVGYDLSRLYLQMLVILGVFFVWGSIALVKYLRLGVFPAWIMVVILIPYFWGQSGLTYLAVGDPRDMLLSNNVAAYDTLYVHDQEINGATWLRKNVQGNPKIDSDNYGERRLISYGEFDLPMYSDSVVELMNRGQNIANDYVYLRYVNVVNGELLGKDGLWYKISRYRGELTSKAMIYDNGGSEVLR